LAGQRLKAWQELRRARLFKRLLVGFVALLIGVVLLMLFAGYQYKKLTESDRQKNEAKRQQEAALKTIAETQQQKKQYESAIKVITGEDEGVKLKALAQISQWINEKSFPSELTLLLTLPRSDSLRVKQELAKVLAQAVETDTKLLSSAETNV